MKSWLLALVAIVLVTGCQPFWESEEATVFDDSTSALPHGWRWESYGGIEVGVPNDWGQGTTGLPWCLYAESGPPDPHVGRPGVVPAIGCFSTNDEIPDPEFSLEKTGTFVWFSKSLGKPEEPVVLQGDRATLTRVGIVFSVQAPVAIRNAILDTLHTIANGTNGCRLTHPISNDRAWRPASKGGLETFTNISAITACKYDEEFLVSSVRLEGENAVKAVANIVAAPIGGGPDSPHTCAKSVAYGEEAIVLEVTTDKGLREVVMRYDSCDHHGFDDGHSVRTLTRDGVRSFIAGSNRLNSYSSVLGPILSLGANR